MSDEQMDRQPVQHGDHTPARRGDAPPSDGPISPTRRQLLRVGWTVPLVTVLSLPDTASAWGDKHFSPGKVDDNDGHHDWDHDWDHDWENDWENWWNDWWEEWNNWWDTWWKSQ